MSQSPLYVKYYRQVHGSHYVMLNASARGERIGSNVQKNQSKPGLQMAKLGCVSMVETLEIHTAIWIILLKSLCAKK